MSYLFNRNDVFDFAQSGGYETREHGDELEFKLCPYCNGGNNRDKYTFSVNLVSGAFKCLRASCNHDGHFVELCRDFDYRLEFEPPKIYRKLPQKQVETRTPAIEYMKSRGISEEITRKYQITTQADNPKILVFPFYDETGKLVSAKYRKTDFKKGVDKNKEWFMKDTQPILFGMKQCVGFDRLIITEGQIDSLSVAEAGFDNAVSVPTGANGFTWLTNVYVWIAQFKEIVVFGDCEHGKITLLDTLLARLPKNITVKAVQIKDYLGEKDANDILCKYGARAVRRCIENAAIPKLDNVKQLADVEAVDINKMDKILTGINGVDRVIRGMAMGQLVILTGKRGEGKSTFMSQMVCAALDSNRSVFVYSGELADFHFKRWLDLQLAGPNNVVKSINKWGEEEYSLAAETVSKINDWYRDRAFIYDNNYIVDGSEFETLPDTIEKVIQQYNVQMVCIDNLMTAMEKVTEQSNLYLAQSNFVGRLKAIATKYQVVIVLVAHPKKGSADGYQDDNDLVAGSSDITNKADIVIKYSRNTNPEDDFDGLIKITKNRIMGTLLMKNDNAVRVRYSPATKRITDIEEDEKFGALVYGWERVGTVSLGPVREEDLPF